MRQAEGFRLQRVRAGLDRTRDVDMIRLADESAREGEPVVTELEPLRCFYPAEEYHVDYLDKNPSGYCHLPVALFEYARKANSKSSGE